MHGNVLCFVQHVDYGGAKEGGREAAGGRGLCRVRVRQYTFTQHLGGRLPRARLYCFLSSSEAAERKMSTLNAAEIEYRAAP